MKRKIALSILSLILVVCSAISLVACGEEETACMHSFSAVQKEVSATCEGDGVKAHKTCTLCAKHFDQNGNELTSLTITKLGHEFGEWKDEILPTCLSTGTKGYKTCGRCEKYFDADGNEQSSLTMEKTAHSFGEWIDEIPATCLSEGVKGHKICAFCEKNFNENDTQLLSLSIQKVSHEFGEWEDEVPATCLSEGVKGHKTCSLCELNYDASENLLEELNIAMLNHDYSVMQTTYERLKTPATDTTPAVFYKSCSLCGQNSNEIFETGIIYNPADYQPNSLTLSIYQTQPLQYGVTYNTKGIPICAVLELTKQGESTPTIYEFEVSQFENGSINDGRITRYKSITEIDLVAGESYKYRIIDYGANTKTEEFTFKAVNPNATSFKFTNISDTQKQGADDVVLNQVLANLSDSEFIIHSGDVAQVSGKEDYWDNILGSNIEYFGEKPIMAIAGNHDTDSYYAGEGYQLDKHFNYNLPEQESTQKGFFYSFDYCNVRFIMLNTNSLTGNQLTDEQYKWLVDLLNNNPNKWTIVSMHNPLYSAGKYGSSSEKNAIALGLQEQLTQLFADKGVDLVLQAHDHTMQRTKAITGYDSINKKPILNESVTTETINGIEYKINPNGTYYFMVGSAVEACRPPVEHDASLFEYVNPSDWSVGKAWAEIEVTEDTLTVVVKSVAGGVHTVNEASFGIKKTT